MTRPGILSGLAAVLGDAGTDNSDASYGGEVVESPYSMTFIRQQVEAFQQSLNDADAAYRAAIAANNIQQTPELSALITEYLQNLDSFRNTAAAVNAGASVVNALGGRVGVVSLPQTMQGLGVAPLLIPAAFAAVVAALAGWIAWARGYVAGVKEATAAATRAVEANVQDPQQRAATVAAINETRRTLIASVSPGGASSGIGSSWVMWALLIGAGLFAFGGLGRILQDSPRR